MSHLTLWLCIVLLIGSATAVDMPFVFGESTSDVAGFTTDDIEHMSMTSDDLKGIPPLSAPQDKDVLLFPNTGGGRTSDDRVNLHVGEIREKLNSKVELKNDTVHYEAMRLMGKNSGDCTIAQVSEIYGNSGMAGSTAEIREE